ncbi:MAG: ATP-binding protein [Desulfobacteraceae bacterium]|nr:ATP-binding protein [Desulfobacteraceae bacterium]
MIPRHAEKTLMELSKGYPAIAITGPRQSGKTTLAKHVFGNLPYVSLENPDLREMSQIDPRGFLEKYRKGAVFDEAQRSPELFSYLQEILDENEQPGRFVLTGSQQFGLFSGISQSLAGRVGLVHLLPFTYPELVSQNQTKFDLNDLDITLFSGLYPPVHDRNLDPGVWYGNYIQTYIERDVRQMINIRDLSTFQRFIRLCAGRIGQLVNLSGLAEDCGINHNTAKAWISILEASYIVFLLQPHHANFNKRMIKTPKLYFYDSGLAAWLLSIHNPDQLNIHSLRGSLFESFIISEFLKAIYNMGLHPNYYFWRDRSGNEIDLLEDLGVHLKPIEIKSGKTINQSYFKGLKKWMTISGDTGTEPTLIYGGDTSYKQHEFRIVSWTDADICGVG